jgi:CubicO group peptidase (beta-lactamase class C family)
MYFADLYWPDKKCALTNYDVIKMMAEHKPVRYFRPGSHYSYCNTGYCVLASIVEKISGMSFRKYMEENIFRRAGMNNTFIYSSRSELTERKAAVGYDSRSVPIPFNYQDAVLGDKGVYSTADDMLKYDKALYSGAIVSQKTLDEAFTPAYSRQLRGDRNYGFGWRIEEAGNHKKVVFHGGWWKGFRTYFIRSIDEKKTVIVLINSDRHIPFRIDDLLDLFSGTPQPAKQAAVVNLHRPAAHHRAAARASVAGKKAGRISAKKIAAKGRRSAKKVKSAQSAKKKVKGRRSVRHS